MARKSTSQSETEAAAREAYGEALPVAPPRLAGRSATEPEIVRWVARNIDNPKVTPADCPDPFAWTLLRQCREMGSPFVTFFVEKLWSKLIPARSQLEDTTSDTAVDGAHTIDLIGRLREIGARVSRLESPTVPAPEVPDAFSEVTGEP